MRRATIGLAAQKTVRGRIPAAAGAGGRGSKEEVMGVVLQAGGYQEEEGACAAEEGHLRGLDKELGTGKERV